MNLSRDIEEFKQTSERELKDTVSLPSGTSRAASVMVPIDASVLQMVSERQREHEEEDAVERKSPLCCRSCCDLVRACIICDIVFILLDIVGILLFVMGISIFNEIRAHVVDDDAMVEVQEKMDQSNNLMSVLIIKTPSGFSSPRSVSSAPPNSIKFRFLSQRFGSASIVSGALSMEGGRALWSRPVLPMPILPCSWN